MSGVLSSRTRVFAERLQSLDDEGFVQEASLAISIAAVCAGNPTSLAHERAQACRHEAARRGRPDLYRRAITTALE